MDRPASIKAASQRRRIITSSNSRQHSIGWLMLLGLLAYAIAPWFNALRLGNNDGYPGWTLLLFGWLGVFSVLDGDFSAIGWLANPLFLGGTLLAFLASRKLAVALTAAAAAFSLGSFLLDEILINEGGTKAPVAGFDSGFWIWIGAIWFNFAITLIMLCLPAPQLEGARKPSATEDDAAEIPADAFQ